MQLFNFEWLSAPCAIMCLAPRSFSITNFLQPYNQFCMSNNAMLVLMLHMPPDGFSAGTSYAFQLPFQSWDS